MQLLGSIGGIDLTRRFLLSTPMETWFGLMTAHQFYGPLRFGLAVSTGWIAVCLTAAYFTLRRRDITGG
jgi:ABC-2 type transport system permease protein